MSIKMMEEVLIVNWYLFIENQIIKLNLMVNYIDELLVNRE